MAGQGLRAAGVGQQVAVQVADGAHDGAGELLPVGTEGAQVVGHPVIGGQGVVHVGVTVGGADQGAAHAVQRAEGAVRTAAHAHMLPQIAHAHVTQDDAGRTVVGVAQVVEVGRLAHVVDLGRGQEGLGGGQGVAEGRQGRGRVATGGQGGQQAGGLPLHGIQAGGLGRAVHQHVGAGHDEAAQLVQIGQQAVGIAVQALQVPAHGHELADARQALGQQAGGREVGAQAGAHGRMTGRHQTVFQTGLVLQQHLAQALQAHGAVGQGLQQDLAEDVEQVGHLVVDGLAGHAQVFD